MTINVNPSRQISPWQNLFYKGGKSRRRFWPCLISLPLWEKTRKCPCQNPLTRTFKSLSVTQVARLGVIWTHSFKQPVSPGEPSNVSKSCQFTDFGLWPANNPPGKYADAAAGKAGLPPSMRIRPHSSLYIFGPLFAVSSSD